MMLVKMMGGLGNQLFQYSFARYLEDLSGNPVCLDTAYFLRHRQRPLVLGKLGVQYRRSAFMRYLWYRLNQKDYVRYEEKNFSPDSCVSSQGRGMFFWGYWQKTEYAHAGRPGILKGFSRFPKRKIVQELAKEMEESDSLSIHVRRGDYRGIPRFVLLSKDYYDRALAAVEAEKADKWYLFSDERSIDEGLLPDRGNWIRMADYKLADYEEFYLMSLCKRNICANSTFSWWASFLNERNGRLSVMPRKWKTVEDGFDIQSYNFEGSVLT